MTDNNKHYVEITPDKNGYSLKCSCGKSLGREDNSPMAHASAHLHIYKELGLVNE
jgi:hypothetical protein